MIQNRTKKKKSVLLNLSVSFETHSSIFCNIRRQMVSNPNKKELMNLRITNGTGEFWQNFPLDNQKIFCWTF